MEYPMFVMVGYGTSDPASIFETIDHEQGHQWFPMLIGSNERRYAWMDEGFNTYQNAFSNERRTTGANAFPGYVENWRASVDNGKQAPLMTPPDRVDPDALGAVGYRKPGAVLLTLRDNVIGREAMDRAMREYARRWLFKHPTPGDFFRTVENESGEDLSWFWNGFFYGTDVLDIAGRRRQHAVHERTKPRRDCVASRHEHSVSGRDAAQVQRRVDAGCAATRADLDAHRSLPRDADRSSPGCRRSSLARSQCSRLEFVERCVGVASGWRREASLDGWGNGSTDCSEPDQAMTKCRRCRGIVCIAAHPAAR
jgi:hypothetical protein